MERQPRWKENAYNLCMEVYNEIEFAVAKFPPFSSAHEGYAILWEEVDELWDEVKNNKHDDGAKQRKEAIQVAAMAIRFVLDISDRGKHRNERYVEPEFRSSKTEFDPDGIPWGLGTDIP
jgi:hypothetical protein